MIKERGLLKEIGERIEAGNAARRLLMMQREEGGVIVFTKTASFLFVSALLIGLKKKNKSGESQTNSVEIGGSSEAEISRFEH